MSYKIKATPEFEKALKDLTKKNSELALRIAKAIKKLSENPNAGKPLSYEYSGLRSLRIEKYRVIYRIVEEKKEIHLIVLGHRKKVY
ncbi:MAG: type II toxin-antitoxin system RelE/ParE family toxin [Archaeoglobaceae archaeon]